jgi:glutamate dehydrogenase
MVTHPRMIGHAAKIADLFLARFHPDHPLSLEDPTFLSQMQDVRTSIQSDVEDSTVSDVLYKMIDIVTHTLKTNVYMQDRYALSLRLDPIIMGEEYQPNLPYGVLFVHGRRFNGYHVRFRDISRGGLRLIAPANSEQLALESARQYDECYGLAFAQQLKNKDIPEGGSKAVCLIDTNDLVHGSRDFVMRKSVKAFTDSILDLVVQTKETKSDIVDYYGKPEVLYLGPDENVNPEDINWIVQQAARRGYDTPAAFMSSKARAGINHKEYGVTSEGVNVYLDVALNRCLGIDPKKDSFTIKMTGGPDGDVGGNEIKILIREYGDNVKIVGIADGSGCAEDPDGLNHKELLRLFEEGLCISNFQSTQLGPDGVLHTVETEEGVKARNSMHNRLVADAFVPCGGRPNTIDVNNYKQFIQQDGTPTSKLIVEGANLFVTAEARQKLFDEAGVCIVKDSSANKGGVITSSYEICAAMLLSEEEFFEHKDAIVEEVLVKLRGLAKLEAELLFRESELYGESLPKVSQIISNAINAASDALSSALDTLSLEDQEQLLPLFRAHLPKTLADLSFNDRVHKHVPQQYIKNAIASTLASKIVYKEGTRFINALPAHKLAETSLKYIQKEKEVVQLMEALEKTDLSLVEKDKILKLLDAGGARTALNLSSVTSTSIENNNNNNQNDINNKQ